MFTTPKQLVINALQHQHNDFCPYTIWIKDPSLRAMFSHYYGVGDIYQQIITNHIEFCGHIKALHNPLSDNIVQDEFGSRIKHSLIPHVIKPALEYPTLEGYHFPDLTTEMHFAGIAEKTRKFSDRFRIVQLLELFFERAWNLRGTETFLIDILYEPKFVEALLDNLMVLMLKCIDKILTDHSDNIEAIGWTDDYGGQTGLLINPNTWRKMFKPRLKIICERIRLGGKYVYFHSCGNIEAILEDLIEIGVDIINPIQPETMDIFKLKRNYGRDITFFGGIGTQHNLVNGTPNQVTDEVIHCIRKVGKSGGLIVAPAKEIMPEVPFDNAIALIQALTKQNFQ